MEYEQALNRANEIVRNGIYENTRLSELHNIDDSIIRLHSTSIEQSIYMTTSYIC